MAFRLLLAAAAMVLLAGCATSPVLVPNGPPAGPEQPLPASLQAAPELTARAIVERATAAAGGETWRRPRTLKLTGYGVFYDKTGKATVHERYEMYRVYPAWKGAAHAADGKVRIQSFSNGKPALLLAFDGKQSYTAAGPQPPSEADRQWSENFGFGSIRFALDEGYALSRVADDLIDGRPAFKVKLTDPSGGETFFGIAQDTYQVLWVGFTTPRGWHERTYSDFYQKPGVSWVQPGRIRLLYNGVKQNEIIWRDFEVNADMADDLFVVPAPRP
jgi:hypothetical protein